MKTEYHPSALDSLRRTVTTQEETIASLHHELAVANAKRARAEQQLAILRGDRDAWARATAELMSCGVSLSRSTPFSRTRRRSASPLYLFFKKEMS